MPTEAPTSSPTPPTWKGLAQRADDLPRHSRRNVCIRLIADNADELVPAKPGNHRTGIANAAQATGDVDQNGIADVMAIDVVHWLELIEIDQKHRAFARRIARLVDRVGEFIAEKPAVGKSGQRVMPRQQVGALFRVLTLDDFPAHVAGASKHEDE